MHTSPKFYKVFEKIFLMASKIESQCKIRFIKNEQYAIAEMPNSFKPKQLKFKKKNTEKISKFTSVKINVPT
jgi:hypothetical protein